VQFTNDIGLVTSSSNPAQPSICELGEPGPGNGLYSAPIDDIGNQMDDQNDEGDRVDDGGRVADVEAKGWWKHEEGWGRDDWNMANRLKGSNTVRSDNSGSSVAWSQASWGSSEG
jgi:hypothetical protein